MPEIQHITLAELTQKVQDIIKQTFDSATYWIVAEISGHKFYPNNDRHYFEFIEKGQDSNDPVAKVRGVSWRAGSQNIKKFEIETGQSFNDGLQVLVKVKVEFHLAYGLSLVLLDIDNAFTLGNVEKQRIETLLKLVDQNPVNIQKIGDEYITTNKRAKLNIVIQNIALLGSPNSEGYNDFNHTISNNQFKYKFSVDIYQSSVQGAEAGKELVEKLIAIFKSGKSYDCVVIIRGGGSKSDFLVFDSYNLSRAVARFPLPIITGLGHQKDISIVDLMANTSTKTPTKAAEYIIAHNKKFEEEILSFQKSILIKSQQLFSTNFQSLSYINNTIVNKTRNLISSYKDSLVIINRITINTTKHIIFENKESLRNITSEILLIPKKTIYNKSNDIKNLVNNIKTFKSQYLKNQTGYLGHYKSVINLVSPVSTLKRGFAIVKINNQIISSADNIIVGNDIDIILSDSEIKTKVIKKSKYNGNEFNL